MSATTSEVLREAASRLAQAGCETPRLDAEILLAFALGCDRAGLMMRDPASLGGAESRSDAPRARSDAPRASVDAQRASLDGVYLDAPENGSLRTFWGLVERRCAREPVAYITGHREFRRLSLAVDRRVLIPRPETELLVEVGLTLEPSLSVVDVGTGSGAVALALKDERPDLAILGVDSSEGALAVARANALRLGLDVQFARGDLLDAVDRCDAVLANLPYVEDDAKLAAEIERYEPRDALFAGRDGLAVIRRLMGQLDGVRMVALEVGLGQADAVEELVRGAGFEHVERLRDLAGIERVVVGRR